MRFRSVKPAAAWILAAAAIASVSFMAAAAPRGPKSLALLLPAMAAGAPFSRPNRRKNGFVERTEATTVDAHAAVWPHGALFVEIRQQAVKRMLSQFERMGPEPVAPRSGAFRLPGGAEFVAQPGAGGSPAALDGGYGDAEQVGDFVEVHTAEKVHLHQPGLVGIQLGQS